MNSICSHLYVKCKKKKKLTPPPISQTQSRLGVARAGRGEAGWEKGRKVGRGTRGWSGEESILGI